ncbi:PIG-L deacetylase family protein [Rhizobium sp. RAF36]|uniref:PIG-L deacetylase family protein n=1 Tax=Rhizobium sp. RAF36 TaxID=3233055 RepID=UPI003F9C3ADE
MLDKLTGDDRVLILSPHLDDAVLSAGGLMDRAVKDGAHVVAATIFTGDADLQGEPSPLVRELHEWWGLGANPYAVRREEDIASIALLGADYFHGGMTDSIYRRDRDGISLYATREAVFSPPSDQDPAWRPLEDLLAEWFAAVRPTIVLCPLAVGRHLDHVVTTETFRKCSAAWNADIYLYEDIPYAAGFFPPGYPDSVPAALERTNWTVRNHVDIDIDFERKFAAILKYESQIAEIFPGLDAERELRNYMRDASGTGFRERFWRAES